VTIIVNRHRDYYQTAEDYIDNDIETRCSSGQEVSDDIRGKIIAADSLIEIQFYPHTPIGFYSVYHYDMDKALDKCLKILKETTDDKSNT
jgi:hypothetical protein